MAKSREPHVVIDPEFEKLIPPLTEDEYNQLKDNIYLNGGLRDPIVLWCDPSQYENEKERKANILDYDHLIIDGHNRWRILEELRKEHPGEDFYWNWTTESFLSNREEAMAWMIRNQLGRRNLTAFARTELSLKLKPLLAEEAKKKQAEAGGAVPQKSAKPPIEVREEIAKAANVSHDTVSKVEKIIDKAPDEVKEQLRRGEVSINKAYNEIRETEQPKPVAPLNLPHRTTAQKSVTVCLSDSDQKTIQSLSRDLHFSGKGREADSIKVFRFMLDYFKAIVDEAAEWKEPTKDFIPDPSAQAIANYFQTIETTEALAGWIVFTSQQFAGSIWKSIAYESKLSKKAEQKEKLTKALKQSMDFITETYQSLEQRQLNEEKGNQ